MEPVAAVPVSGAVPVQEQRIARLGDRAVAAVLDGVPLFAISLATGGVTAYLFGIPPAADGSYRLEGGPALLSMLAGVALWCSYYFLSEWMFSTTIGKEAMAIEVKSAKGGRCTLVESLFRNALRPVDGFGFYIVAFLVATFSSSNQRLGDRVAGTIVTEKHSARRRWALAGWIVLNALLVCAAIFLVETVRTA